MRRVERIARVDRCAGARIPPSQDFLWGDLLGREEFARRAQFASGD
jgi:hypothetical protein